MPCTTCGSRIFDRPCHVEAAQLAHVVLEPVVELREEEAAHHALAQEQLHVVAQAVLVLGRLAVLRHGAADDDAPAARHVLERVVELRAADVVEEDVDAVRREAPDRGAHVLGPVVDGPVQAEVVEQVGALLRALRRCR